MIDESILTSVYNKHKKELYIYLYRLTGSRESAEDILHDCFVNIIRYSEKKQVHEETLRALLYKTAHNLAVNHLKKKARSGEIMDEGMPSSDRNDNPLEGIIAEELTKKISELINGLDEETRSMFTMRKESGMSLEEIAQNTGKSERTVRRKLTAALQYLEENLKKAGFLSKCIVFLSLFYLLIVTLNRKRVTS